LYQPEHGIFFLFETAEHRLPQQADRRMATVLAGPRIGAVNPSASSSSL
jgi:hypothetical protein